MIECSDLSSLFSPAYIFSSRLIGGLITLAVFVVLAFLLKAPKRIVIFAILGGAVLGLLDFLLEEIFYLTKIFWGFGWIAIDIFFLLNVPLVMPFSLIFSGAVLNLWIYGSEKYFSNLGSVDEKQLKATKWVIRIGFWVCVIFSLTIWETFMNIYGATIFDTYLDLMLIYFTWFILITSSSLTFLVLQSYFSHTKHFTIRLVKLKITD